MVSLLTEVKQVAPQVSKSSTQKGNQAQNLQ